MKYFSEIMLLTKQNHSDELNCWLDWHLNVIGFDHVVIFNNESPIDVQEIISQYPSEKIEYHYVEGWPNQYKLYNEHLKDSEAQWTIPLDDDEFLYIGDKYNNSVNNFIQNLSLNKAEYNKFYVLWVNMFSPEYKKKRDNLYIDANTYYSYEACNKMYNMWAEDNGWGKCLINNGNYKYVFSYGRYAHSPKCENGNNKTVLVYGDNSSIAKDYHIRMSNDSQINNDCFIAHYQFKSDEDWEYKCNRGRGDIQTNFIASKKHIYSELYKYSSVFNMCTLLSDKWNEHTNSK